MHDENCIIQFFFLLNTIMMLMMMMILIVMMMMMSIIFITIVNDATAFCDECQACIVVFVIRIRVM